MINAISIDLEYWYSNDFILDFLPDEKKEYIVESVNPILMLLEKYSIRATFFVLGSVVEKYPQLVEKIYDAGHEIASHGYSHKPLYDLGRECFEMELKKSVDLIKHVIKEKPLGFRAPSFSINNSTKWAFEILEKYSFKYDSSIFPIKTMLYGVPNAPIGIYKPSKNDVTEHDPKGNITEFPLTVMRFIKNIPIAGGFYLRILPIWFIKCGIKKVNEIRPAIIYIHPWETNKMMPRLQLPLFSKFFTYYGLGSNFNKLEILLKEFKFKPVIDVLNEI